MTRQTLDELRKVCSFLYFHLASFSFQVVPPEERRFQCSPFNFLESSLVFMIGGIKNVFLALGAILRGIASKVRSLMGHSLCPPHLPISPHA